MASEFYYFDRIKFISKRLGHKIKKMNYIMYILSSMTFRIYILDIH